MTHTKSQGRKHILDKFYTKPEIALFCIKKIDLTTYTDIIEPSAGSGSFSNQIPNIIAYDLQPEHENIQQKNWFHHIQQRDVNKKILVIGNPPFGQQNSLAIHFMNHAAEFCSTVAFILPISFRKESIQKRIHPNLHLTHDYDLPNKSFLLNDEEYHVPCIFQIWEWKTEPREQHKAKITSEHFIFVKKDQNPDLRIQRVGGKSGKADTNLNASESSNYFIKIINPKISINDFINHVNNLPFPTKNFGVGPRSISKIELIKEIENTFPK